MKLHETVPEIEWLYKAAVSLQEGEILLAAHDLLLFNAPAYNFLRRLKSEKQ
jgi:hypothetical protein